MLETLAITSALVTATPAATKQILEQVLAADWKSPNQTAFRRNWLLSLGLTDRKTKGDVLTEVGQRVLEAHDAELGSIRDAIDDIIEREPGLVLVDELDDPEDSGATVVEGAVLPNTTEPPASWSADQLDLQVTMLADHLAGLAPPKGVLEQACAALSAGKHLLLVGPPGTGKTELALVLAKAAKSEDYCHGAFLATASADWTTFDTIGGYALEKDQALRFRPGVFLAAIESWQWLLIDELNRADVDRAFGELMTVLAGQRSDTPYQLADGRKVSVGADPKCTHRIPGAFRVIATMNTWDKTSLFRLSYAVQRRFAMIHVGIPDDATYSGLIDKHGDPAGIGQPLDANAKGRLKQLFCRKGLLEDRAIGPAVLIDIVRYMRRRSEAGDGLAEAIAMYLLPQLEGLEQQPAITAFRTLQDALTGWTSSDAIAGLRLRFKELFPHVKLPEA